LRKTLKAKAKEMKYRRKIRKAYAELLEQEGFLTTGAYIARKADEVLIEADLRISLKPIPPLGINKKRSQFNYSSLKHFLHPTFTEQQDDFEMLIDGFFSNVKTALKKIFTFIYQLRRAHKHASLKTDQLLTIAAEPLHICTRHQHL
jgi:hypothetical protein